MVFIEVGGSPIRHRRHRCSFSLCSAFLPKTEKHSAHSVFRAGPAGSLPSPRHSVLLFRVLLSSTALFLNTTEPLRKGKLPSAFAVQAFRSRASKYYSDKAALRGSPFQPIGPLDPSLGQGIRLGRSRCSEVL